MGKKELLANLLYHSGLWRPVWRLHPNGLVILNYHRIRQDRATGHCLLDEDVCGPTQSAFERQVKWLKAHFELLSESELLDVVRHGAGFRNRFAAITFDDGYRDNYDLALPVLDTHAVPAIFLSVPLSSRSGSWAGGTRSPTS